MLALMSHSEAITVPQRGHVDGHGKSRNVDVSLPPAPVQTVSARTDLFLDGDEASHVLEVLEGIVCAYRLLSDGSRHIIAFYYPGDMIGYLSLASYTFNAQALTQVRVRRVSRASLDRAMSESPVLAQKLLQLATIELTAAQDHLLCLAAKSAEAKAASFLLALARRNAMMGEDPRRIELPMTRVDIGDYLGLTIETVSRMLSKFRRASVIELPRPNLVLIRDTAELQAIANG